MEITNINLVYFSATYTTRKIVREIARQIACNITEYDITNTSPSNDVLSSNSELLIVGVPVYSGRVPSTAIDALNKFKGCNTPAIVICTYGNRAYDDSLLELKDIVETNGFTTIAAGAFIAEHSIFPKVATTRPDSEDIKKIEDFGHHCMDIIFNIEDTATLPKLKVNGSKPYKVPKNIPIHPTGNKNKCNKCGTCVTLCPVQAISETEPYKTDSQKCISCGRCIVVCTQKCRNFNGLLYKIAGWKFVKDNSTRKEPEYFTLSL